MGTSGSADVLGGRTSGVEVLLDERRDGVDGRLVVAADLDRVALAHKNITVCNVPDYGTEEIADHALGHKSRLIDDFRPGKGA